MYLYICLLCPLFQFDLTNHFGRDRIWVRSCRLRTSNLLRPWAALGLRHVSSAVSRQSCFTYKVRRKYSTSSAVWLFSKGYDICMSTVRIVDPIVATTDTHPWRPENRCGLWNSMMRFLLPPSDATDHITTAHRSRYHCLRNLVRSMVR